MVPVTKTGIMKNNRTKPSASFLIDVDGIEILVEQKNIKNIYLRVKPPDGRVCMSIPARLSRSEAQQFAESRKNWVLKQRERIRGNHPVRECLYQDGEIHPLWGRSLLLCVKESEKNSRITVSLENMSAPKGMEGDGIRILMKTPAGTSIEQREAAMREFYRSVMKAEVPAVLRRCEEITGLRAREWHVKNMKTRWGTCNPSAARIWLNLKLVLLDPECLEYVIIHELCHLVERYHNARFYNLMDQYYPKWREVRRKMKMYV